MEENETGIGNVDLDQKINLEYKNSFPLISSVQAGQWSEICDIIDLSDAEYLPTTEKAGKGSFWLTIEGKNKRKEINGERIKSHSKDKK